MNNRQRTLPSKFARMPRHHVVIPGGYTWTRQTKLEAIITFHEWVEGNA